MTLEKVDRANSHFGLCFVLVPLDIFGATSWLLCVIMCEIGRDEILCALRAVQDLPLLFLNNRRKIRNLLHLKYINTLDIRKNIGGAWWLSLFF